MTSTAEKSILDRLVLKPVVLPDDDEFLRDLYFLSRNDINMNFPGEEVKQDLLLMQYRGQMLTYQQQFPAASHDIVELDERPIGRLMIDRQPEAIRVVDISLIPEKRNMGIGTSLLKRVLAECSEKSLYCVLQVLAFNRARALYERLGFRVEGNDGIRLTMRWNS